MRSAVLPNILCVMSVYSFQGSCVQLCIIKCCFLHRFVLSVLIKLNKNNGTLILKVISTWRVNPVVNRPLPFQGLVFSFSFILIFLFTYIVLVEKNILIFKHIFMDTLQRLWEIWSYNQIPQIGECAIKTRLICQESPTFPNNIRV